MMKQTDSFLPVMVEWLLPHRALTAVDHGLHLNQHYGWYSVAPSDGLVKLHVDCTSSIASRWRAPRDVNHDGGWQSGLADKLLFKSVVCLNHFWFAECVTMAHWRIMSPQWELRLSFSIYVYWVFLLYMYILL